MIEEGLVALLKADAGVAAAIAGRLYPVEAPPDSQTYPFCAFRVITSRHSNTLDGAEMSNKTIQFDCFGSYSENKTMLQALRNVLVAFVGTLPDGTKILNVDRGNEMDDFASVQSGPQRVYHSLAEYEFEYVET